MLTVIRVAGRWLVDDVDVVVALVVVLVSMIPTSVMMMMSNEYDKQHY